MWTVQVNLHEPFSLQVWLVGYNLSSIGSNMFLIGMKLLRWSD